MKIIKRRTRFALDNTSLKFTFFFALECPAGTFGYNCTSKCPKNYYGGLCSRKCDCSRYHVCSPSKGCIIDPYVLKAEYGNY